MFCSLWMFSSLNCKAFSFIHLFINTDWLPCHCCNKHPSHILLLPPFLRNRYYTFQIFIGKKIPRKPFIFCEELNMKRILDTFADQKLNFFINYISLILKQMRNIWDIQNMESGWLYISIFFLLLILNYVEFRGLKKILLCTLNN